MLDGVVLIEPVRLLQQEQDPLERFELLLGHVEQEAAAEAIQLGLAWIDLSESRKKLRDGGLGVRGGALPAEIVEKLLWRQLPPRRRPVQSPAARHRHPPATAPSQHLALLSLSLSLFRH